MTDLVIPEEAYEQAADALAVLLASWPLSATPPHHPELSPRDLLRAFAITALEAAHPTIRQQVAEQIATALDERHRGNLALSGGDKDIIPRDGRVGLATGYQRAAQIAREIGAKG